MRIKPYLLIFCCSLTVLVYEILIGRIFSVIFSYDILFIIISLAILGLGLGGICFKWLTGGLRGDIIDNSLLLLPASLILSLTAITKFFYLLGIIVCTVISMLPFLLAGIILTGLYSSQPQRSGLLYFLDLGGGAFGCLASFPLVQFLGVTDSVIFISILPAVLSLTLYPDCRTYRPVKILALLLTVSLLFFSQAGRLFEIGPPQLKWVKTPLGTLLSYPKIKSVWKGYT